ncbi:MAG: class I tRNA ligase family protein [Thermomicrobiales bacterium]
MPGLPAENAAIRHNIHPAEWTYDNIDAMRAQYRQMGAMIDWTREVITCNPDYYHWNQWIFLQMLERGLAHRKAALSGGARRIKPCFANEQVLEGNICELLGSEVVKRDLEQWYFNITHYVEELLAELDTRLAGAGQDNATQLDRSLEGARLTLRSKAGATGGLHDAAGHGLGATFMVLAPEHPLLNRSRPKTGERLREPMPPQPATRAKSSACPPMPPRQKSGVFTGAYAINPDYRRADPHLDR